MAFRVPIFPVLEYPQCYDKVSAAYILSFSPQPGVSALVMNFELSMSSMVGRREKQAVQQPESNELQENGPSKFRRKLSYGLAFISNPLSQRKTTPGRHSLRVPSLAVTDTEADTGDAASTREAVDECDTSFSSTVVTRPNVCSDDTPTKPTRLVNNAHTTNSATNDTTPRVVPRSRTFSFIPRPVSIQALATTSVDMNTSINSVISLSTADPKSNASPSKIPTPSPPLSENRGSSPRQHLSAQTSSQLKYVASTQLSEARSTGTITKTAMRSHTTPKLVNVTNSQQPTGVTVPRKSALKKVAVPPVVEKPLLQENFSDSRRITQRRSHIRENPSGRESLAVIGNTPKRKSFGPAASAQSSQLDYTTPPADRNRSSMYSALQTPMTARRFQPRLHVNRPASDVVQVTGNGMFSQPRLMGPKDPPTPTPSIDFMQPGIQDKTVRNDLQRKTLGTPNGLAGVWRSSRALAATNHEVRKLPRSFTFHSFGRKEAPPPLPSIPEQNRPESLAHITKYQHSHLELDTTKPRPEDNMQGGDSSASTIRGLNDDKYRFSAKSTATRNNVAETPATECSDTSSVFVAPSRPPPPPPPPDTPVGRRSLSLHDLESHSPGGSRRRPWPISFQSDSDNADIDSILQVKDYMPPLYWAGRFQSRFDHWRTEAMLGHLNPDHVRTGPMDGCNLDQEKLASCYIFGQLRDLCTTNQAADSLWEFEYRYRKDNKLLGNPLEFPAMLPYRKQDDKAPTHQGAFGRAVRKLTPRKSSLVNLRNLLKGKGKGEEEGAGILSEGEVDTSSGDS
ncbi:hypothetical protein IAQ61_002598 [Plenodomus lingam]|uniref:uncharacterized protein n=1 Tax=Leptosphaeria maculans TaxID=5022 RepID=UPI0033253ED1|nr:hypothetical protein IAQ61_002598 [Plenodomus lingam]